MTPQNEGPASSNEDKRARLQTLLAAQEELPLLTERLSGGFFVFDESTAWRWARWIEALQHSPAWNIVQPALTTAGAWPEIWTSARKEGFSAGADHLNALFFQRLFARALQEGQQELARSAWEQLLLSWSALKDGAYLQRELLKPMINELTSAQLDQVLGSLLTEPIKALKERAFKALRLNPWEEYPQRRPLIFTQQAFLRAQEIFDDPEAPLMKGALKSIEMAQTSLQEALLQAFEAELSTFDLAEIKTAQIEALFLAFNVRSELLENPHERDRFILRRGLNLIWELREIGRDEELFIIDALSSLLQPAAERLREADEGARFGIEGAIADLDVFIGEEALSIGARQEAFESALQICPGHRNASRMLSYLLLERANRQLLKTSALPAATSKIGLLRRQVKPILSDARAWIERAEELFPDNDLLGRYQYDLQEEWRRFQLDQEAMDDEER